MPYGIAPCIHTDLSKELEKLLMKHMLIAAAAAVVALPSLASAQDNPFQLVVDPVTGDVVFNVDGSRITGVGPDPIADPRVRGPAEALAGFEINGPAGTLNPAGLNLTFGQLIFDTATFATLGAPLTGPTFIAALSLGQVDLELVDGFRLGTGIFLSDDLSNYRIEATFVDRAGTNDSVFNFVGEIVLIPEPATAGLIGIAGLAALRRRRA